MTDRPAQSAPVCWPWCGTSNIRDVPVTAHAFGWYERLFCCAEKRDRYVLERESNPAPSAPPERPGEAQKTSLLARLDPDGNYATEEDFVSDFLDQQRTLRSLIGSEGVSLVDAGYMRRNLKPAPPADVAGPWLPIGQYPGGTCLAACGHFHGGGRCQLPSERRWSHHVSGDVRCFCTEYCRARFRAAPDVAGPNENKGT